VLRDVPRDLALMLKTYLPDLPYVERLIESFREFNADGLMLYVVAPDDELGSFKAFEDEHVVVLGESLLSRYFTSEPILGIAAGYINQEVVKLAFWELDLCDNYLCMDSDAVFIRPFGRHDFVSSQGIPYAFLTEDFELRVEPEYYNYYWVHRERMIRDIQAAVGLDEPRLLTCHQHAVFSTVVLRSLKTDFMEPHGYSYTDLIGISPYEFSWYNMWWQKAEPIPVVMREPVFKTFHSASQHLEHVLRGATTEDLARGYVGVVVNSGFGRTEGVMSLDDPRYRLLGRYAAPGELVRAAWLRIYRQLPSLQRLVARLRRNS
jgi:hypothetical protein